MKREITGSWNSESERGETEIAILHNSKWPENLWRIILEYIKNNGKIITRRGATRKPQALGARPPSLWATGQPPGAHLLPYEGFWPRKKNQKKAFGMKHRRLEAEPGQELFCSPVERFRRENFPPGGGNRSHRHHQWSSHHGRNNLHQHLHQHHLISNPSSSLVFNLCLKTLDWYLWVASSVDYIL